MAHIKIKKGLDIPIKGKPEGKVKELIPAGEVSHLIAPPQIALNFKGFPDLKLRLLVKPGDAVKIGQPLAEDKDAIGRLFVSPAGGVVKEIRRGAKRILQAIVIDVAKQELYEEFEPLNASQASKEQIIERLKAGGLFPYITKRPFSLLADPAKTPRNIFVKALESAPFVPPSELQVAGHEKEFQIGLDALKKLTEGSVHLVYREGTACKAFTEAKNVEKHTAEGPHPISNYSLHIQEIDPIRGADDVIWTLNAHAVVAIGHFLSKGRYFIDRVISIAGPAVLSDRVGYFKAREGYPVGGMIAGRIEKGENRLISGDPLMGDKVSIDDFLQHHHYVFCAIKENKSREFLHFFKLGLSKFTFSKAYLSGFFSKTEKAYDFTTNQHGEHRAFIDSTLYDKVQPLHIPTMLLVKAVMAEDFDLADTYGLIHVDSEDFALPSFVDPSKNEMTEIIRQGLKKYSKEVLT